jgi:hypothetical protein
MDVTYRIGRCKINHRLWNVYRVWDNHFARQLNEKGFRTKREALARLAQITSAAA